MFHWFKRDPVDRPPPPKWLMWGVGLFIAYAVISNALFPSEEIQEKTNWNLVDLDAYNTRLFPGSQKAEIHTLTSGEGMPTRCGQTIQVRYAKTHEQDTGASLPEDAYTELKLRIGGSTELRTLAPLLVGLQKGGEYLITVPVNTNSTPHPTGYVSDDDIRLLSYKLEIHDVSAMPETITPLSLRVFDTLRASTPLTACGSDITLQLQLWNAKGERIYSSHEATQPLTTRIGNGTLPAGVEWSLEGLGSGGSRTVLVPPALQAPLAPNPDSAINKAIFSHREVSPDTFLIADIHMLSIH